MAREIIQLELMAFPDVEEALRKGYTSVLVPCGAVEQHGPHLPLCMDADHAERLSVVLAQRMGDALIAPTIKIGCSSHHLTFAGTISLHDETFEAIWTIASVWRGTASKGSSSFPGTSGISRSFAACFRACSPALPAAARSMPS